MSASKSTSLVRQRQQRSLEKVTAASGAFGAMTAAAVGFGLVAVIGGGIVSGVLIIGFAIGVGGAAGWMLGRASSGLIGGRGDDE